MDFICSNLEKVNSKINNLCNKKGISSNDIELIAVSKTFGLEYIQTAYDLGIRDFGENKVQELLLKYDYFSSKYDDIRWHLIGHLQTNKVKKIIGKTHLIHSVDSLSLAEEIDKYSCKAGIITNILIQINISGEESKSGIKKEECEYLVRECSKLDNISIKGLMAIAKNTTDVQEVIQNFRETKDIFDTISSKKIENVEMKYLSMGMSNDYEIAIQEGSNMIRLGSLIFGKRNYNIGEE